MALAPIQIFSPDPGHITDFSAVSVSDIFDNVVAPRFNQFEPLLDENAEYGLPGEPEDLDAASLFQPRRADFTPPLPPSSRSAREPSDDPLAAYALPPPTPAQEASAARPTGDFDPAEFTFNSEARRDKQGRLSVYAPPSGDGGGSFEVAGITARYQPKEAARLRELIRAGRHDEAEEQAKAFYRQRAEPFTRHTDNRGLQLQLSDTVHHRGEGGLRRVLQRATGSRSTNYESLIGQISSMDDPLSAFNDARRSYEWEEVDRGRESRRKFRQGLRNRFNKADQAARRLTS